MCVLCECDDSTAVCACKSVLCCVDDDFLMRERERESSVDSAVEELLYMYWYGSEIF